MIKEFYKEFVEVAKNVRPRKTSAVTLKAVEELGELSTEVAILEGMSYKKEGDDGVVGEAVDLILCAMDVIYTSNPNITAEEVDMVVKRKSNKWLSKCGNPETII